MYYWTAMNALKLGQKVKVQGHGGITYAETFTAQAEAYSIDVSCRVRLYSFVIKLINLAKCEPILIIIALLEF